MRKPTISDKRLIRAKNAATASAPTSDIEQITVEQLFNREKQAALQDVTKLKRLIEMATLQSLKPKPTVVSHSEIEDMYQRIMNEPAPVVMLQVASEFWNHLENIEAIYSMLHPEAENTDDQYEDQDWDGHAR